MNRGYELRLLGWTGCALYIFIDSLTYVYLFHFEQMSGGIAPISLFMLSYELSGRNRVQGGSHLYVGIPEMPNEIFSMLNQYKKLRKGASKEKSAT